MALIKKKFTEIPADAVILTENEALQYQIQIMKNWSHKLDTIGFRLGPYILAGASFATGFFFNSYFRQKFKLLHYGRVSTYLPICVLPATLTLITHWEFVLRDVVLQKGTCPVCLELRASSLQAFLGCAFPLLLAPASTLALAHKYVTYNVPYVTREPRKVIDLLLKLGRPISNMVFYLFVGQAVLGSIITYYEGASVRTVNSKLALLEQELEHKM